MNSLRTRLVLSFFGVIVITAGVVVVLANRITADRFTFLVSNTGQAHASDLSLLFADYYARVGSWEGVESLMPVPAASTPGRHGQQRGGPLRGMLGSSNATGESCASLIDIMPMMGLADTDNNEHLLLVNADGRIVADSAGQSANLRLEAADLDKGTPIVIDGQQVGTLIVASGLGVLSPQQNAFLSQANQLMIVAAIVTGLAVLLVGSLQARRIVAPVRALAAAARRVAAGDLAQRVPVTSQDELGEMAVAFNTMAAQLEQQHALRRRAMADVAHELRTPLSVLQIDLESIQDGLTDPAPEAVARLLEEVALLNRLVEDLRMLSLAEAGELQMEAGPVDVRELVQATAGRVQVAAREKGVSLRAELPGDLSPVVGDRQRLAQVLFNLLSNALRHTPPGGQITVRARQVGAEGVQVSVQDSGEGIPPAELPHVFERFYRADRARSRDTGGSGLGLSIARSLVEVHGGRIWVDSVEGQGSTFTFALPVP